MLAFSTTIAHAGELPKRKPGLWELGWHVNDAELAKAGSQLVWDTAKMCIDETTDAKLATAYDPCDPPLDFAFFTPQFTSELVCEVAAEPGVKAISRSKITFTGTLRIALRTARVSSRLSKARANTAGFARANGQASAQPVCSPAISLSATSRNQMSSKP